MTPRMMVLWSGVGMSGLGVVAALLAADPFTPRPLAGNDDVANVTTLLAAMRGTAPVPCALALTVVEGNMGWGNWSGIDDDSTTARLRRWLAEGLTDPAAVPMLKNALAPGDACVRQTAARLLGRSHNLTAVRALTDALKDADPTTRELAALGLGLSGDPAGFDPLVTALRDAEPRVRASSAEALGRLGDHRATTPLVPLLKNDRAPEVRRAAAYALGNLD